MPTPRAKRVLEGPLSRPVPLLLLGALACLYLCHFRLPLTPIWLGADQWGLMWDTTRMWEGGRIYRDFIEMTPPGTEVAGLLFFRLVGLQNWIPHVHVILLGLGLTWLTVIISRKVIGKERVLALLPGLLFLTFAFLPTMTESHRWFSSVASMAGLAVLMEERTPRRLIWAGLLFGVASFFTQTQGVFAVLGVGVFLVWERRRGSADWRAPLGKVTCLLASFVVTVIATEAYFVWKAGLENFLYCLVRYPVQYFPAYRATASWHVYMSEIPRIPPWTQLPSLVRFLLIHALLPLVYLAAVARHWRARADEPETARVMLLSILGLSLFAGVAPSPSFFRLCTVSPPALIIPIFWMRRAGGLQRLVTGSLWVAALGFAVIQPARMQTRGPAPAFPGGTSERRRAGLCRSRP